MIHKNTTIESNLQRAWDNGKISTRFPTDPSPDVLKQLLSDKRSSNTRRAYEEDATRFFLWAVGEPPTRDIVLEFLHLTETEAKTVVLNYRSHLQGSLTSQGKPLSDATINRRISAIKSLVQMGRRLGCCAYTLEDIKANKVTPYRDTKGITPAQFARVLSLPDQDSLCGSRNYAILLLLWCNALRRNEVSSINIGDLDLDSRRLRILGKGKGSQYTWIDLDELVTVAIAAWIKNGRAVCPPSAPLFISLDPVRYGHRLTGESIRQIVSDHCQAAGISKTMSPHRLRHSAITAVLDASGGNVRKAQKLSRHANIETLMLYDDNRNNDQREMSGLLASMISPLSDPQI